MNKKLNALLFMLVGTLVNIILMLGFFIFFLYLSSLVLTPDTPGSIKMTVFFIIMVASVGLAFVVYSRLIKFLNRKWNLEANMQGLFSKSRKG